MPCFASPEHNRSPPVSVFLAWHSFSETEIDRELADSSDGCRPTDRLFFKTPFMLSSSNNLITSQRKHILQGPAHYLRLLFCRWRLMPDRKNYPASSGSPPAVLLMCLLSASRWSNQARCILGRKQSRTTFEVLEFSKNRMFLKRIPMVSVLCVCVFQRNNGQ